MKVSGLGYQNDSAKTKMEASMAAIGAVLFTVDDEAWTIGFWDQCEFDNAFGPITYDSSDQLREAMNYAKQNKTSPTVFVLDSRAYLSKDACAEILADLRVNLRISIDESNIDESLNGIYVAAWIRVQSPRFRVIVLTAFARDIDSARKMDPGLGKVFDYGVAEMFVKTVGEKPLRSKVKTLFKELQRY